MLQHRSSKKSVRHVLHAISVILVGNKPDLISHSVIVERLRNKNDVMCLKGGVEKNKCYQVLGMLSKVYGGKYILKPKVNMYTVTKVQCSI
nr:unnamed protein product [Callosobruchus chinensis]